MPVCVNVVLEDEVVLQVAELHSGEEISRFKATLEHQGLISRSIGKVVLDWRWFAFPVYFALDGVQTGEVFGLTFDVVIPDQFFHIY